MMKIKNLNNAAQEIKLAVKRGGRILLYGDSDLDGIASVVIVEEAIKNLGGRVDAAAFPDREKDGYGLNLKALEFLRPMAPALLVTLDLGISNHQEIEAANAMGFEVVVVDHHEILGTIPAAKVVVDPKQPGDNYPFKGLCNAGIAFKLAEELLGGQMSQAMRNSLLELAALATISDMVPQTDDNVAILHDGLQSIQHTFRPGLRAFIDLLGLGEVAASNYGRIISALNAAESKDFKNLSYELLTCPELHLAKEIAEQLLGKVRFKQQQIQAIVEEVERRMAKHSGQTVIFEGDLAWKSLLAGPAASLIAQKYRKPTFIYKKMDDVSVGSVRSLEEGQNSVEAMKSCANLLITFGGHPKASGFRVKNENLEQFKKCLIEYFSK